MATQLDRFRSTVAHQVHSDFLYLVGFTPDLETRVRTAFGLGPKADMADALGMFKLAPVHLTASEGFQKPDYSGYFADIEKSPKAFINDFGVLEIPGSQYHFTRYVSPLRNAQSTRDIESFPFPSVYGFFDNGMSDQVKKAHKQGIVAHTWVGHMYETSWQVRGYEQFLTDMMAQPEWAELILDKFMEKNLALATASAKAGVDVLYCGDDVANQRALMFSIDTWRHFMKPRWAKVFAAARSIKPDIQIWYHSDGNIMDIIPELIEIGVTILNPIQPECMDALEVKKRFGKDIVLDGVIGTQALMPFGTPGEVKTTIREMKKKLGYDGAFIISNRPMCLNPRCRC